jgi:hypothetical protein
VILIHFVVFPQDFYDLGGGGKGLFKGFQRSLRALLFYSIFLVCFKFFFRGPVSLLNSQLFGEILNHNW